MRPPRRSPLRRVGEQWSHVHTASVERVVGAATMEAAAEFAGRALPDTAEAKRHPAGGIVVRWVQ